MASVTKVDKEKYSEIWIDRQEALNSLNQEILEALIAEFKNIPKTSRVVLLRSRGHKSFIAGADIKSMQTMTALELENFAKSAHHLFNIIEVSNFLVVACVQGFAFGGGLELALACDLIIASDKAKFSLPELNLGLIPGFGGTQRLLQRCGIGFARKLIFTSEQIGSETAYANNIIDFIVKSEDFESEVQNLAQLVISKSSESLEAAKKAINKFYCENQKAGLSTELEQFSRCFNSTNGIEGLKAFIEKRKPDFK